MNQTENIFGEELHEEPGSAILRESTPEENDEGNEYRDDDPSDATEDEGARAANESRVKMESIYEASRDAMIPDPKRDKYFLSCNREATKAFFNLSIPRDCALSAVNKDFIDAGADMAVDCAQLLRFLSEDFPEYRPGPRDLLAALESPFLASLLYKFFIESNLDPQNSERLELVKSVDSRRIHLLRRQPGTNDAAMIQQLDWALKIPRISLREHIAFFEKENCK